MIALMVDHPVMREGLAALIDGTSDLCVGHSSLEELGEKGRTSIATPNLVVTDLRRNGRDNREWIQTIKRRFPGVPVLVLHVPGSLQQSEEVLAMGADAFMCEPGKASRLLQAIRGLLRAAASRTKPLPEGADAGG